MPKEGSRKRPKSCKGIHLLFGLADSILTSNICMLLVGRYFWLLEQGKFPRKSKRRGKCKAKVPKLGFEDKHLRAGYRGRDSQEICS